MVYQMLEMTALLFVLILPWLVFLQRRFLSEKAVGLVPTDNPHLLRAAQGWISRSTFFQIGYSGSGPHRHCGLERSPDRPNRCSDWTVYRNARQEDACWKHGWHQPRGATIAFHRKDRARSFFLEPSSLCSFRVSTSARRLDLKLLLCPILAIGRSIFSPES